MVIYYDTDNVPQGVTQRVFPLERVRMVSAHEGVMAVTPGGESLYKEVRTTKADEPLLKAYIEEGLRQVEEALGSMLTREGEYTDTYCRWTLKQSYSERHESSAIDMVAEAVAIYTLYRWTDIRLTERSAAYQQLWQQKLRQAVNAVCEKARPVLN